MLLLSNDYPTVMDDGNRVVNGEFRNDKPLKFIKVDGVWWNKNYSGIQKLIAHFYVCQLCNIESHQFVHIHRLLVARKKPIKNINDVGLTVRPENDHICCVESLNGQTVDVNLQFDDAMNGRYRIIQNSLQALF